MHQLSFNPVAPSRYIWSLVTISSFDVGILRKGVAFICFNGNYPPPLYKLRQSPKLIRSLRLLQLGHGRSLLTTHTTTDTGRPGSKREDCMVSGCKQGEYNAQIYPKWANTHNKCVHDSM